VDYDAADLPIGEISTIAKKIARFGKIQTGSNGNWKGTKVNSRDSQASQIAFDSKRTIRYDAFVFKHIENAERLKTEMALCAGV